MKVYAVEFTDVVHVVAGTDEEARGIARKHYPRILWERNLFVREISSVEGGDLCVPYHSLPDTDPRSEWTVEEWLEEARRRRDEHATDPRQIPLPFGPK